MSFLDANTAGAFPVWALADTAQGHAQTLLTVLELKQGANVVCLGGTGELARLTREQRPDLRWTVVNPDGWLLKRTPKRCHRVHGDLNDTRLASGGYDAVVMVHGLGRGNPVVTLQEAARILREGGVLVLHDLYAQMRQARESARQVLRYELSGFGEVALWARIIGFDLQSIWETPYLDEHGHGYELEPVIRAQCEKNLCVYTKSARGHAFDGKRCALQFSGGKDSLACLLLLRPFVMQGLPVYWTHTGDTIPETLEVVEWARGWVPDFRVIEADVMGWKAQHGMPSDMTTAQSSWMGEQYAMSSTRLVGRFECCWNNLMRPMHERMQRDGVELVIRGTKKDDTGKVPAQGETDHYEVLLPLVDWSHAEVFEYLQKSGAPVNKVYEYFKAISAPECLHCTAWWDDGKAAYLKARHPAVHAQYVASLEQIRAELQKRMRELDGELIGRV